MKGRSNPGKKNWIVSFRGINSIEEVNSHYLMNLFFPLLSGAVAIIVLVYFRLVNDTNSSFKEKCTISFLLD